MSNRMRNILVIIEYGLFFTLDDMDLGKTSVVKHALS